MPPFFLAPRAQIENHNDENSRGDVTATLKLLIEKNPQQFREEVLTRLQEKLPVEVLYYPSVLSGLSTV